MNMGVPQEEVETTKPSRRKRFGRMVFLLGLALIVIDIITSLLISIVAAYSGLGTPIATPIILSAIDQNLVIGITTCYTGTGYNDGYQMTFTWGPDSPSNYSQIESNITNLTVVFTITAHDGN